MPMSRLMASGSATDVPPNFITTVTLISARRPGRREPPPGLWDPRDLPAQPSQQPLAMHQFRVEDRDAGGAADRVVAERDELVVEDRTGTQPSDRDGHAAAAIDVERRLRPVALAQVHDRLRRRRWQTVERPGRRPRA